MKKMIETGAPEEMFEYFNIDLTTNDGLKAYGEDRVRIGLITCEEYRLFRENIPHIDGWWWTATADSTINSYACGVNYDGALECDNGYMCNNIVRPLCVLKSEILVSYLNGYVDKRNKAIDMMKYIAAAWNIKTEEIFEKS